VLFLGAASCRETCAPQKLNRAWISSVSSAPGIEAAGLAAVDVNHFYDELEDADGDGQPDFNRNNIQSQVLRYYRELNQACAPQKLNRAWRSSISSAPAGAGSRDEALCPAKTQSGMEVICQLGAGRSLYS
jgi:hypothetical protein